MCHRAVADSGLVLDGVAFHLLCYVCVACGKSSMKFSEPF